MLSLAMIVKNEVQTIERTIESVRGYVDEIIVGLDTESNDGTADIVKGLADRIVKIRLSEELRAKAPAKHSNSVDWGFSRARNQVLGVCNKDNWRLILDGHETILNPDKMLDTLEKAIAHNNDSISITCNFEPPTPGGIPQTKFSSVRVLSPSIRYANPIHNAPLIYKSYVASRVIVEHMKSKQDNKSRAERNVQRSDANIEGLRQEVKVDPKNARSWFYLATAYRENAHWTEAVEAYAECLVHSRFKEERWHARYNSGGCLIQLKELDKAREQFVLAIKEFPQMAEAYYLLADMAYKQENFHEAQVWLEKCIQMDLPSCKLFVNPRIYLFARYDLLSMVYSHLRQYGKSIEYAKKALEVEPNERVEKNITFWKSKLEQHSGEYYDEFWGKTTKMCDQDMERIQMITEALGSARKVLDIGSGPGHVIESLQDETEYVGVDISRVAREHIEKLGGRAISSMDELNGEKFDGCILGEVLEHMEDDVGLLREVRKYLEPGAVVVASVPRYYAMFDTAHARNYTTEEFRRLMMTIGDSEILDSVHPWMICRSTVT